MVNVKTLIGGVVVTTSFFLFFYSSYLVKENKALKNDNDRFKNIVTTFNRDVKKVNEIENNVFSNNTDVIKRMHEKGYFRRE